MNKTLHRNTTRTLCALVICFALIGSLLTSVFSIRSIRAHADDGESAVFTATDMSPSNNRFASGSGSAPANPDSWTGGGIDGSNAGGTISGILDLSTYAANKDSYKLNAYDEYKDDTNRVPNSPFGEDVQEGTNRKVLLINVPYDGSRGTAYGYSSASMTFAANRFYHVSVWVRTGDFAGNSGAAIRLTGMEEDVAITDINTYTSNPTSGNSYNWQRFHLYVATSSYTDRTVSISLRVGDSYENSYKPAYGYAMFDNVEAEEISPATFYTKQKEQDNFAEGSDSNTRIYDFSGKTNVPFDTADNLSFEKGTAGWTQINGNGARIFTYNSGTTTFLEDNAEGFTADPLSANGKSTEYDSTVLVLSQQNTDTASGVSSAPFTVKRYHYYRVSAWVKTQDVSGGDGATLAVAGIRDEDASLYGGNNFLATVPNCTGNADNAARGGFTQYSVYIKGSVLQDYSARVECRLGTTSSQSRGIAFFDNVTVEEISPADYNSYNGNGSATVDFDTQAPHDGSAFSFPDTGITNGAFYQIDAYEPKEFAYPLAPSGWTKFTADTADTDGYAANAVDTDKAISGVIPTDPATFDACLGTDANIFGGAVNPRPGQGSILMLYSETPTAYGYRSSDFTAAADTPGTLTVRMMTQNMTQADYGASLVLKDGNRVIATIEKIKTDGAFKTYTFYIEPNTSEITTLRVEIWLGNNDRNENRSKLSAGHVFVDNVAYAAITDDTTTDSSGNSTVTKSKSAKFKEFKNACDADKKNSLPMTRAAYSYKSFDFAAYDSYDTGVIKYPYNWSLSIAAGESNTVRYGYFDAENLSADSKADIPDTFQAEDGKNGILMLRNMDPAATTLRYNGSVALSADTYYRIDISVRVVFPEQDRANAKGVSIALDNTKYAFTDIRDTQTKPDSIVTETFRTYTFIINPGSEASSVTPIVTLGESDYSKQSTGNVYINSVTYTDITNTTYEAAVEAVKRRDKGKTYDEEYKYTLIADMATAQEPDDETPGGNGCQAPDWWLIPSILFAVAILVAIVGFIVRKLVERKSEKKGVVEKRVSYDRSATLNREHNKNAAEDEKVPVADIDDSDENYETFDDDVQAEQKAPKKETPAPAPQTEPEAQAQEQPVTEEQAQTEASAVGEPAEPKAEKAETASTVKQDSSYIDRFDD